MSEQNAFDWSVFDGYEDNFTPQHQGKFRPNLTALPDGPYDFEVMDATPDTIQGDAVCRVGVRVAGGAVLEHVFWLSRQESVNSFAADLVILGASVDRQGRKLADVMRDAIAKLPGSRFKGSVRHYKNNKGEDRANLDILCRIAGSTMPPPPSFTPSPAPAAAPLQGQVLNPPAASPTMTASDVPF